MTSINYDLESQVQQLVHDNNAKEQQLRRYESLASQMNRSFAEAETDKTLLTHLEQILSTSFYQRIREFLKEVYNPGDCEIDLANEMAKLSVGATACDIIPTNCHDQKREINIIDQDPLKIEDGDSSIMDNACKPGENLNLEISI